MVFLAVETADELRRILGRQCSPMRDRAYIVGPDIHGRQCHFATCLDIHDARRLAKHLNERAAKENQHDRRTND